MTGLLALSRREIQPERMDDPALDPAAHRLALTGLARINRWTRASAVFRPAMRAAVRPGRPVRLLDVATGSGDIPRALDHWARSLGLPLEVHGCDISPVAVAQAQAQGPGHFFQHDVVSDPLPAGFDVVICSLFLHHLADEAVVAVLRHMQAAGRVVVVSDLCRSRWNWLQVGLACRVLSRSPVVHYDGPVSVRAALTPPELLALAQTAGLVDATVRRVWPCRMLLTGGQT